MVFSGAEDEREQHNLHRWSSTSSQAFMNRNPSSFFRDITPFEVLRTLALPSLLEQRAKSRKLRVLSAVCAAGQEAYSIGLTLAKHFPELADWDIQVLGLDPSEELLEPARSGAYSQLVVQRGLPAMLLIQYFERAGHLWAIKDPPKSWVDFECTDVTQEEPGSGPFDVIFLANVLSKVDVDIHSQILDRLAGVMASDGFLLVGSGEGELLSSSPFVRIEDSRAPIFRLRS